MRRRPILRGIDLGTSRRTRVHGRTVGIIRRQRHVVHGVDVLLAVLLGRVVAVLMLRPLLLVGRLVGTTTNKTLRPGQYYCPFRLPRMSRRGGAYPVISQWLEALSNARLGVVISSYEVAHDEREDD